MRTLRSSSFVLIGALSAVSACGGAVGEGVRPKDFTGTGAVGGAAASCSGAPKFAQPLVVDFDGDTRLGIETAMQKGVLVVSYDCSNLRVMPRCRLADGGYEYAGASYREMVVRLKSQDDLSVNLPLSAGKLGSEIQSGRTIELALVSVGLRSTTVEQVKRAELVGSCEGATHIVQAATLGAFSMATGSVGKAKAVAELFSVGASGSSESSRDATTRDGSLEDCRKADEESKTPTKACKAPISLQLLPITGEGPKPVAAAAKAEKTEKPPAPKESPCRDGYVFANDICTRAEAAADVAHLCNPKDAAECKAQCDKGSAKSCYNHALLSKGEEAKASYKKACEGKVGDACGSYSYMIYNAQADFDAPMNVEALKVARQGCRDGGGESCAQVGDLLVGFYTLMMPKKPDPAGGLKAYERGCALGSDSACYALGEILYKGVDAPQDEKRGLELLDRACVGDSHGACSLLAKLLSTSNPERAFRAAIKVCDGLKGITCDDAVQVAIDVGHPKEALAVSEKACADWPYNCGKTADMYKDGVGTAKNAKKAVELYETACGNGKVSRSACEKLAAIKKK